MFVIFAIAVIAGLYQYYSTPKPTAPVVPKPGDLTRPRSAAGSTVSVVFGTVKVQDPIVTWFGDVQTLPIKDKGVTTGYTYWGGMQLVLCHGKIDRLKAIYSADQLHAYIRTNETVAQIVNPGELTLVAGVGEMLLAGGTAFPLALYKGNKSAGVHAGIGSAEEPDYVASKNGFGNLGPVYFGRAYITLGSTGQRYYFGTEASTPAIAGVVQRIYARQCAGPDSYDVNRDKVVALLHFDGSLVDETGKTWALDTGDAAVSTDHKFGTGGLAVNAGGLDVTSGIKSAKSADWAFGTEDFTVELWAMITARTGNTDCLIGNGHFGTVDGKWSVWVNNNGAFRFQMNGGSVDIASTVTVSLNTWAHVAVSRNSGTTRLFVNGVLRASSTTVATLSSTAAVYIGNADTRFDAIRGVIDEVRITKGLGRYTANFDVPTEAPPTLPPSQWYYQKALVPSIVGDDVDDWDEVHGLNLVHAIREVITDRFWGMKQAEALIDDVAFMAAADVAYDEGMGVSIEWNREGKAEDFLLELCQHLNCAVYEEPTTGLWTIKLIRSDYVASALTLLDDSSIVAVEQASQKATGDLINTVTIEYKKGLGGAATATAFDQGLLQTQGTRINKTISYPGFTDATIANRVALRDLRAHAFPAFSCTLRTGRKGATLRIGQAFRFTRAAYNIDQMVMRVVDIKFGGATQTEVQITCCQDVFASPAYAILGTNATKNAGAGALVDPLALLAIEAPYHVLVEREGKAETDSRLAVDPGRALVLSASARPSSSAVYARLYASEGAGSFSNVGTLDYSPACTLVGSVGRDDVLFAYENETDFALATVGEFAVLHEAATNAHEIVRVDTLDTATKTITLSRGLMDTIPQAFTAPALYLCQTYNGSDPTEYTASDGTINVQICSANTRSATALLALAVGNGQRAVVLASRANKPYPPGNVEINGSRYPDRIPASGDTVLAWRHRDRQAQAVLDLIDYFAASVGPEAGVTYTLRVLAEDGATVIRTVTGETGASYTYDNATEIADSGAETGDPSFASVSALLHFDGTNGSTVVKDSGPLNNYFAPGGSLALATAQSKWGGTSLLNGATGYALCTSRTPFQLGNGNFTLEAWVYMTGTPTVLNTIISYWSGTTNLGWLLGVRQTDRYVVFYYSLNGTGGVFLNSAYAVPLNTWTHIAVVRSGATITLYVGGTARNTGSIGTGTIYAPAIDVDLMCTRDTSGNRSHFFANGYVDDVRITKGVARTISVPTAAFPDSAPVLNGSLTIGIKAVRGTVESSEQTRLVRRPGYGRNYGYYYGGDPGEIYIAFVTSLLHLNSDFTDLFGHVWSGGSATISTAQKKFGAGSAVFSSSYKEVSDFSAAFAMQNQPYTIELWVYHTGRPSAGNLDCLLATTARSLNIDNNGHVIIAEPITGGTFTWGATSGAAIALNTWTHIALSRIGTRSRIFINGVYQEQYWPSANSDGSATGTCRLGADLAGGSFLSGYIDEVRITKGVCRYESDFTPAVVES